MTSDKRLVKRIPVELPVMVYLFDNKEKTQTGDPLAGHIRNFSPMGAALSVNAILINGEHLFYSCQDNPDTVLQLVFELRDNPGNTITVPAIPVWFDRDLASDSKQFVLGLKFLVHPRSPEIKGLSKEACKDEKRLVSLWKKFF